MQVIFYELLTKQRYFAAAANEEAVTAMLLGIERLPHETDAARARNAGLGVLRRCGRPFLSPPSSPHHARQCICNTITGVVASAGQCCRCCRGMRMIGQTWTSCWTSGLPSRRRPPQPSPKLTSSPLLALLDLISVIRCSQEVKVPRRKAARRATTIFSTSRLSACCSAARMPIFSWLEGHT